MYFYFLDGEEIDFVVAYLELNIQGYAKGHGLKNWIVMFSSPKTVTFVLVAIEK